VAGSFNGWNTAANFLVQEGNSGIWSSDIPAARANDPLKNQYKYHLNKSIWKRDPRGRQVVHSGDNTIIYDPNAFTWAGDNRLAVNQSELVIYEMHIGAFYDPTPGNGGPGKFADAI
jgi:1,4-alpha-glucan branching enzyme